MKTKLTSINFLRAAACIGIFTYHCYVSQLGYWALSLFIMMSGFLLVYNGIDRAESFPKDVKGCARYSFNKIKKLYPLYAITLIALAVRIFLLAPENPPRDVLILFAKQFLVDFLLIQSWLLSTEWAFSHNVVGWYLSTALLLYFAFPHILRWIKKHKGAGSALRSMLIITVAMVISAILAAKIYDSAGAGISRFTVGFKQWFVHVFPLYRLGDFTIGCLLGYVFTAAANERLSTAKATGLEAAAIIAVVVSQAIFNSNILPEYINFNVLYVPANALLIYSFALGQGRISGFLDCKLSNFVADYSVEIFLIHFVVIQYASPFATILPLPFFLQQWAFLFFVLIFTFLSVYIYRRLSRRFPFLSVR